MKKLILTFAISSVVLSLPVYAEEPKPENESTFNLGAVSDYRYRGISQSRLEPALQGGADYVNNPTGIYAGTWLSTIKWTKDAGGSGDVEWDVYFGKRGELSKDVNYDVGFLTYVYPSNGLANIPGFANANTSEIYGQLNYGPAYAKYSHSLTNLFGFVESKNSGYLDLGASFEIEQGMNLAVHFGRQFIKNNANYSYNDWKIGVTKDAFGVTFGLAAIGTNANEKLYVTPTGKFTGKKSLLLSVLKNF